MFTKDAKSGQWVLSEARDLNSSIQLRSLGEPLNLSDIYAKVKFTGK